MKSRTVLNIGLFVSIMTAVASTIGFILTIIVKDEQIFVPINKSYYKSNETESDSSKEMFYFGKNIEQLSSANIFDVSMRNINVSENKVGETTTEGNVPDVSRDDIYFYFENPDKCPAMTNLTLTGTLVTKDMDKSVAILKEGKGRGDDNAIIARVGSSVVDGVELVLVWRNFVILKTSSGIKCIGEGVGEAKQSPSEQKFSDTGIPPVAGEDDFDIRKTGENQYVIRRQDLQKVTGNLNALARQARIVPSKKDNGFKVFSIRSDSLYSKIGIQNGDVIKSINGIELSSPDKALEAYSRLQSASKLSLDIIRRGQNETMEYIIE